MDRKLYSAYEKMTMPSGCSQRIEALLQERAKPWKQQKNQMVYQPKPKPRGWASAAALVCLAVVISLSGVLAFLHMGQWEDREILPPEQTTDQRIKEPPLPLSEEGEDFLLAMCSAMPDWENYYVLDDRFWEEFLYFSFCNPEEVKDGKAQTIIGEVPCENDRVLITREQAEAYAFLAMGCDLPLPSEGMKDGGRIRYLDGVYHIRLSESGSRRYTLHGLISQSAGACAAEFLCESESGDYLGKVRFQLRSADNENGFLVTGKLTEWNIPLEPAFRVTEQDYGISLSGKYLQQSVRGNTHYSACQYYLPWESFSRLPYSAMFWDTSDDGDDTQENTLYRLEDGCKEQIEPKTLTHIRMPGGEKRDIRIAYTEYGEGSPYLISQDDNSGYYVEWQPVGRPWWAVYRWEDCEYGQWNLVEGPWRLDLSSGEITDLWGNVPEENRNTEIQYYLSQMEVYEDGCFLIPSMNGEREITFLYVDPEKGLTYDLEAICGSQLDDCVSVSGSDEIYCWKEGQYWRIHRDAMWPEYLGKLQENVVFASGVQGRGASFSIERMEEGGYRVFDYGDCRFLTIGDLPNEDLLDWSQAQVSPDGRKLLIPGGDAAGNAMVQILDCDTGKHLIIERGVQNQYRKAEWLASGEVYIQGLNEQNYTIYTLE